jgi:hypothetical protein
MSSFILYRRKQLLHNWDVETGSFFAPQHWTFIDLRPYGNGQPCRVGQELINAVVEDDKQRTSYSTAPRIVGNNRGTGRLIQVVVEYPRTVKGACLYINCAPTVWNDSELLCMTPFEKRRGIPSVLRHSPVIVSTCLGCQYNSPSLRRHTCWVHDDDTEMPDSDNEDGPRQSQDSLQTQLSSTSLS